jgi:hypothetical protein
MEKYIPRAFRPKRAMILALAEILKDDAYLDTSMSLSDMVASVMNDVHGQASPNDVFAVCSELINEAGRTPN